MTKRNDASDAQIEAADPANSTWLSANAGSGKTRVLTDRVARLLLEEKVPPQRILCLTYTKAAASEMQNRLFKRLGEWAMMPDAPLSNSLKELGLDHAFGSPDTLQDARRLFASAIETPGGLKIQTIHSFCASLLRRFPLEARVSPNFTEMDDRTAKLLRADVLEKIATEHPTEMAGFAAHFTGDDTDGLLQELSKNRELFSSIPSDKILRETFDLGPSDTAENLISQVFLGSEVSVVEATLPQLQQGSKTDVDLAKKLEAVDLTTPSLRSLAQLEPLFLSGAKTKEPFTVKARPPTKDVVSAMGADFDQFDQLRHRVAAARETRLALAAYEKTKALHAFAAKFLPALEHRKQLRGWLDFDDLILKARALLTDKTVAAWVLYRLDGGIDHVLVDEAQDTSPRQWDVVRLLTQEFTSGDGARDTRRTVFVVGDKKQSIYSFQGADPDAFDQMRDHFQTELNQIGTDLQSKKLLYSFRSADPILRLVDATFTPDLRKGMGDKLDHIAFKDRMPGRVDLWNWIEKSEDIKDKDWFDPVDTVGTNHHSVILADRIADQIETLLATGQIMRIENDEAVAKPIEPRDFLILVQSRKRNNNLFDEIIRACKARNLPLAGADRLRVGGELGVKDLSALLSYLATPEDDLSLAAVLRSPLCGFSEAELFDLAYDRDNKFLSRELEKHKDRWPETFAMLDDLRRQADYLRPYDLLERVLTLHKGRENLLARLGREADEGITALLDQALAYERVDVPSLTGFLGWLASDDVTIKRQIDSNSNQIRVMTVHGAKGLEAPIVILPDTIDPANRLHDDILNHNDVALWKTKTDDMPAVQKTLADAQKIRQAEERMRLLYVAMTRAESWLIVCGAGQDPKADKQAWYPIIERGMEHAGATPGPDGIALRLENGGWPDDVKNRQSIESADVTRLPDWGTRPAIKPVKPPEPVSPSKLEGAKALPGMTELTEDQAKARGTAIHKLLEHLPQHDLSAWPTIAGALLADHSAPNDEDLVAHATRVLTAPHLSSLFAPTALAEVDITAVLPSLNNQQMVGTIDRLVIEPARILAVDFKSNALVPEAPEQTPLGILRQMGAYLEALEQVYPGRRIEIAILWTETAQVMTLPHDIVRNALSGTHIS